MQKKVNLVLQSWSNPASWKLVRRNSRFRRIQCIMQKKSFPSEETNWKDIVVCQSCYGNSRQAEISKLVMRMVRHYDLDEREPDGAILWNSMCPKLLNAFQ